MKKLEIGKVKKLLEEYNYYATENLTFDVFLALFAWGNSKVSDEQAIYSVCLEGPTGAGKTFYAETYTKLVKYFYDDNIYMLDYQCDATTGKSELTEDIRISSAIGRDASTVNIPGKLVKAIQLVNEGKKVVLFLDEFEKSRQETDTFLYQFLQKGKINTQQFGDLEIKEEYKNNLQVIFCKNDNRELSEPLLRRNRIIRVDYMSPELFNKAASNYLLNGDKNNVDIYNGLLNLVSLIYKNAYDVKETLTRLPAYSEMIIAIKDAAVIMKYADAPQSIIYNRIINGMFKKLDDVLTMEASLMKDGKLKNIISSMKNEDNKQTTVSFDDLIGESYAKKIKEEYASKLKELKDLVNIYDNKIKNANVSSKNLSFNIGDVTLEEDYVNDNIISNFNDSKPNIRRGVNIFNLNSWCEILTLTSSNLKSGMFIEELINNSKELDLIVYENGFGMDLKNNKLGFFISRDNGNLKISFMSLNKVIDISNLSVIKSLIKYIITVNNNNLSSMGIDSNDKDNISLNCLVYSNNNIGNVTSVMDNIYLMKLDYNNITEFYNYVDNNIPKDSQDNYENVIKNLEKDIMQGSVNNKKLVRIN